ncbi:MAG: ATP-binding protein [Clostridia bacterium]|nr:ATP-binding protein [Clostridia bacterium]
MAFDKEILREIRVRIDRRRIAAEEDAKLRLLEIHDKIPRIAEIDRELRLTPVEIVRAAFARREDAGKELEKAKVKNLTLQKERENLLTANGFSPDYLDVHYTCTKCEDTGYIDGTRPCECLLEEYKKEQVKKLKTDFGFELRGFDAVKPEYQSDDRNENPISPCESMRINLRLCRQYAEKYGEDTKNLFITGGAGIGKTLLASCIAFEVAKRGFSVKYGTAFDILGDFEEKKFNRDANDDIIEDYKKADLLIIDDLGTEMITQFTTAALYNLITTREVAGKGTIIISPLSLAEIATKYTPQIKSRLEGFVPISIFGEDIRKKLGK